MVVSPDVGGVVRARALAKRIDAPLAIVDKRRERAGESEVMNIIGDVEGRACILVDDIVDSGGTLCNAAEALLEAGRDRASPPTSPTACCRAARSRASPARKLKELVITDSIQPTEAVRAARNIRVLPIADADRRGDRAHRGGRVGVEPVRLTTYPRVIHSRSSRHRAESTVHADSRAVAANRHDSSNDFVRARACCGRDSGRVYSIPQVIRSGRVNRRRQFRGLASQSVGPGSACRIASRARAAGVRQPTSKRRSGDGMALIELPGATHGRIRSTWSNASPSINDWSFERAGDDEITMLVGGTLERLPGLLHLDERHRGAASRLRVRPQGAGAPPHRGAAAHRADQRAALGRPFRSLDQGRHGDVPPCAGAGRRRRGDQPAMPGAALAARSRPARAISRPSSSWSGPASRRAQALDAAMFETSGEA